MQDSLRTQLQRALGDAYTLDRELMGGGMSRVFVAVERALDREVVVKVLPPDLAAGVNRERFRREIQLAAQLQHPHIVPLLAAGESGELLYYTMPFIRGESLRAALEARGALSVRDVVRVLHDVVDALAYAHERGVIHRDIKPANVLMSGTHALITDFGVAKALSASLPVAGVTTSGIAIGTPAYMAPEQLAGDPNADHRVDVYAVGLLAYELLTGASPFSSLSPQQTMAAQLTQMPEPLAEVRADVPTSLSRLVMRCLEKNPDDRPTNARDLLGALDAVSTPNGLVFTGTRPVERLPSRRLTTRAAALIAVVLTLGIGSAVALTLARKPALPQPAAVATAPAAVQSGAPAGTTPLTHADSLAIAAAVQRHMSEVRGPGVASIAAESLAATLERAFADSVRQARITLRAEINDSVRAAMDSLRTASGTRPPLDAQTMSKFMVLSRSHGVPVVSPMAPGAPMVPETRSYVPNGAPLAPAIARRVAVAAMLLNGAGFQHDSVDALLRPLADSLRVGVASLGGFTLVPSDSVRPAGATTDAIRLARESGAGVGVAGLVSTTHDGQAVVQLFVADMRYGWRYTSMRGAMAPLGEVASTMPALVARAGRWLAEKPR